jgi:hypothetical protein
MATACAALWVGASMTPRYWARSRKIETRQDRSSSAATLVLCDFMPPLIAKATPDCESAGRLCVISLAPWLRRPGGSIRQSQPFPADLSDEGRDALQLRCAVDRRADPFDGMAEQARAVIRADARVFDRLAERVA